MRILSIVPALLLLIRLGLASGVYWTWYPTNSHHVDTNETVSGLAFYTSGYGSSLPVSATFVCNKGNRTTYDDNITLDRHGRGFLKIPTEFMSRLLDEKHANPVRLAKLVVAGQIVHRPEASKQY